MEIGDLQGIKAIIKSLVLSCPNPNEMTLDKLGRDYNAEERQPIPFRKLGFQNLESFLRSIPDTVRVCGNGCSAIVRIVRNEKSDHIHQMISEQKKPPRNKCRGKGRKSKNYVPQQQKTFVFTSQRQNSRQPFMHSTPFVQTQQIQHEPKYRGGVGPSSHMSFTHAVPRNPEKYTTAKCGFYNIPESKPQFTPKYARNSGDGNEISPTSQKAHVPALIPQIPESQLASAEYFSGKTKSNPLPAEMNLNSSYEEKIDQIESTFKKSVLLADDNEAQKNMEAKQNTVGGSSFIGTKSPKQSLIDALLSVKLCGELESQLPDKNCDLNTSDEAVPESALNDLVYRLDFPENTVVFGAKIPSYNMPRHVQRGTIFPIFISEIHSPFKFWFHFRKENHELDTLMNDIEHFYVSASPEEFRIPRVCIIPGQVCAALFKNMWYRAEVLSTVINGRAKVLYLDYGTVLEIPIENIKYLATAFARIPSQAMRGCLSHIKPRGLHWVAEATKFFISMVRDLPIYAQVSEIDEENRIFHFVLCNTFGEIDMQVNKALVEKGFALYDEEWQEARIKRTGHRWRHPRESFPTFPMLEFGIYPAFADLVKLQNLGIDYEAIIDKNIFHPGKLNDIENAPDVLRNLPFKLLTTNPFRLDIVLQLNSLI